jgi:homoserine O-acetyltransferase
LALPKLGEARIRSRKAARHCSTPSRGLLYAFRASEDYDPSPHLEKIAAPFLAINPGDDFINPPDLPMMRSLIGRVKRGQFVEIPVSEETLGHSTIGLPRVWAPYVERFLKELP